MDLVSDERWMTAKDLEGSCSGGIWGAYHFGICLEELEKTTVTSVRVAGLWAEIWELDLPFTNQEC
jgi:hypothetical protein